VLGQLYVDGNLTISGNGNLNIGALYVGGTLTVSGNPTFTNLGPTWVGGDVQMTGNGNCKLPLLVAGGNITISGDATWGGDGVPPNQKPCIAISVGAGKNVEWRGNSDFFGLMAATQGSVDMRGNGKLHGSILSKNGAIFSGNPNVVYDDNVVKSIQFGSVSIAKLVPGTWAQIATQ
jgi:hypothetical protein